MHRWSLFQPMWGGLQPLGKAGRHRYHLSGKQIQPRVVPKFQTFGKQQLHPKTNPQQGHPGFGLLRYHLVKAGSLQLFHGSCKGSHAG